MNNASATALSGLQAAQTRLHVSAHNVANAQTEGFRPDTVRATPQATGGVQTQVEKRPAPGVDLLAERVEQLSATYAFRANLQTLRTTDDTLGSLLDASA